MTKRVWMPLVLLMVGCGDDTLGGDAVVNWELSAEDVPNTGLAADDFVDDWAVDFSSVVLPVGFMALTDPETGEQRNTVNGAWMAEMVGHGASVGLTQSNVNSTRSDVSFESPPVDELSDAALLGAITPQQAQALRDDGYSLLVEGTGSKDGVSVDFSIAMELGVLMEACENGEDGTIGIAPESGGVSTAQITVHLEHLFWNQLGTEEASLAFQAIADADANEDGFVGKAELDAVNVADIGYETGGLEVDTLYEFIVASMRSAYHFNGDGVCRVDGLEHDHDH